MGCGEVPKELPTNAMPKLETLSHIIIGGQK